MITSNFTYFKDIDLIREFNYSIAKSPKEITYGFFYNVQTFQFVFMSV